MLVKRSHPGHSEEGWRARKRQKTRQLIADAGLRLFLEHGFEATTLDAIAEAAGIARRTFFHYFDSKEALLYVYEDEVEHSFRAAFADVDSDTPPFDAVALALRDMIASFGSERARKIDMVVHSTDALRVCRQADYERLESFMFSALSEKWPDPTGNLRLRLIAIAGIGALRVAVERWRLDASGSLQDYVNESFAALRSEKGVFVERAYPSPELSVEP
jgi:AcrR family transcriptional regulator